MLLFLGRELALTSMDSRCARNVLHQCDQDVVDRMKAIFKEKAGQQTSSEPPPSSPATLRGVDESEGVAVPRGNRQGRGPGGGQHQKTRTKCQKKGAAVSASEAVEREIAEMEAAEGKQQEGSAADAQARERKLSEEARAHDMLMFEEILRTSLLLQKAAMPIHQYST